MQGAQYYPIVFAIEIKQMPTIVSVLPPLRPSSTAPTPNIQTHTPLSMTLIPLPACVILSLCRSWHTVRVTLTHRDTASVNVSARAE